MTLTHESFIAAHAGKTIIIPGYKTGECVAPFWAFNALHKKESYVANGACNLWSQDGVQPYIWDSYTRVAAGSLAAFDWVIWAGNWGAYPNGGSGHIAYYLRPSQRAGYAWFLSENPGAFREQELSLSGVLGALRANGVPAANPKPAPPAGVLVNRRVTQAPVAWVRTAPRADAPLAPGLPAGLARGELLAVKGYVAGADPFPNDGVTDDAWYVTKSGYYVWANAAENNLKGLPKL